ncbi:ABC transporter permease subunit [Paenibacillus sp. HJGM_3]|uniref:ABC transporter permease subunit n=1 Tax=Paenibacillus sp. HJGM_3 TaxID=3379816 RepID=UPI00385D5AC6
MHKGAILLSRIVTAGVFAVLLAAMPVLLRADARGLRLEWSAAVEAIGRYIRGLGTGESFLFRTGSTEHAFWEEIGGYAWTSFSYAAAAAILGLAIGITAGLALARTRRAWLKLAVELLSLVPDFLVIVWLQFIVVLIYKKTGVLLAKVGSTSSDDPAFLLPLVSMTLIPILYMMRSVAVHAYQVLGEDYVLHAKAKGLPKLYTYVHHVLPNALPFIKAEVHKIAAIIVGNLFIMEYLFNLRGITKLLLSSGYASSRWQAGVLSGYQLPLTANCLAAFMLLYACLYGLMRGCIWLLERRFARE